MKPTMLGLALLAGCTPGSLPDELSEPTAWLFGHFDDTEDAVGVQIAAMAEFVGLLAPDGTPAQRSYAPDPLDPSHVADVDGAELPAGAARMALAGRSEHELRKHLRLMGLADQACLRGAATAWSRTFEDGSPCFVEGFCDDALVRDQVTLSADPAPLAASLRAQLRAVPLDDGRDALVLRRWLAEAPAEPLQGTGWYGLEVWFEDAADDDLTWWVQATWTDLSDGTAPAPVLRDAAQSTLEHTEAFLTAERADCADPGSP